MSQVTSPAVDTTTEALTPLSLVPEVNTNAEAPVNQSAISADTAGNISEAQSIAAVPAPTPTPTPEVSHETPATATEETQPSAGAATSIHQDSLSPANQVTLSTDDLDDFRKWQSDKRNRRVSELSKGYGNDVGARRNTLVLRRVDCREIAPDADVLAYLLIYAMKEPLTREGKKVQVTDTEINAYLILDYEFTTPPTLEALSAKVKDLGGTESIIEDE